MVLGMSCVFNLCDTGSIEPKICSTSNSYYGAYPKFKITDEGRPLDFVNNNTKWQWHINFETKETLSIISILMDLQLMSGSNGFCRIHSK